MCIFLSHFGNCFLYTQDSPCLAVTCPQCLRPSHLNYQSRKCTKGLPISSCIVISFSGDVATSKMILAYVKLTYN